MDWSKKVEDAMKMMHVWLFQKALADPEEGGARFHMRQINQLFGQGSLFNDSIVSLLGECVKL